MKKLGIVNRYNGLDAKQCNDYVKIHSATYIRKILSNHGWLQDAYQSKTNPIPMREDSAYMNILDTVEGPELEHEKEALEDEMGFSHR